MIPHPENKRYLLGGSLSGGTDHLSQFGGDNGLNLGTQIELSGGFLEGGDIGILTDDDPGILDLLELSGARLAAQRRTAAQIEALEQLLLEQESRCHDRAVRASYQLDRKFHHEIFLASGNTWMQEEIEKLRDHFLRIETQSAFDSPEQAEHVILEHRGILTAICAGDEKRAEEAMRYHLDCTAKRTLIHITDGLAD